MKKLFFCFAIGKTIILKDFLIREIVIKNYFSLSVNLPLNVPFGATDVSRVTNATKLNS